LASDLSAAQLSVCRLTAQVTISQAGRDSRRFAGAASLCGACDVGSTPRRNRGSHDRAIFVIPSVVEESLTFGLSN